MFQRFPDHHESCLVNDLILFRRPSLQPASEMRIFIGFLFTVLVANFEFAGFREWKYIVYDRFRFRGTISSECVKMSVTQQINSGCSFTWVWVSYSFDKSFFFLPFYGTHDLFRTYKTRKTGKLENVIAIWTIVGPLRAS